MQAAVVKLRTDDFDDSSELALKVIWHAASEIYKNFHIMPSKPILYAEIDKLRPNIPALLDDTLWTNVLWTVHNCIDPEGYIKDRDLVPAYAIDTLRALLNERQVLAPLKQSFMEGSISVAEIERRMQQAPKVGGSTMFTPFARESKIDVFGAAPREPTGVTFLDLMLSGGTRAGEVYGFIAPSGGGKTTFSNQIAVAVARQKQHAFVFSYEEAITPEYLVPVVANMANIDRTIIEKIKRAEDLDPDNRKKYEQAQDEIGPYLHFIDMSGKLGSNDGYGGAAQVESTLRDAADSGLTPRLFVIDWFWIMLKRFMATSKDVGRRDDRQIAQEQLDLVKQLTGRIGTCWGWVNQQMAPAEAGKANMQKRKHEQQAAAEFKSFSWFLNGCLTLTTLDENSNVGTLNYSKARSVRRGYQTIKLEGKFGRFAAEDPNLVWDVNRGTMVKPEDINKVPRDEERRRASSSLANNYKGKEVVQ